MNKLIYVFGLIVILGSSMVVVESLGKLNNALRRSNAVTLARR